MLRALVAEVRGLRADLARDRRPSHLTHEALLPVLARAVKDNAFSAREVMQHAALVDGDLRAALHAADLRSARQLGKWFRTIEGQTLTGLRLDRLGADNQGVIWRVSYSHTHPDAGGRHDERGRTDLWKQRSNASAPTPSRN